MVSFGCQSFEGDTGIGVEELPRGTKEVGRRSYPDREDELERNCQPSPAMNIQPQPSSTAHETIWYEFCIRYASDETPAIRHCMTSIEIAAPVTTFIAQNEDLGPQGAIDDESLSTSSKH